MKIRLLPTDQTGPRPGGHLPWGTFLFWCYLCGDPVGIEREKIETVGEEHAGHPVNLGCHAACYRDTPPLLNTALMELATAQLAWELRSLLN